MTVIIKVQDPTGNEIGSFEAEDQKSLGELAAMHGVEILQSCGTGFCGVCLCDVVEGGDAVELNKTGEHVFEVAMDEGNHPKQLLACVSGVKSEYFSDEKDHTIVIKKLY